MRLTIFLLFVASGCFSQTIQQTPNIDLNIKCIGDSLVFQLSNQTHKGIKYAKSAPFLPGERLKQGNLYYLQLEMEGRYFNIYPEESILTSTQQFSDTLHAFSSVVYKKNFKTFFPFSLKKGEYKIILIVEYSYNKEIFFAESNRLDFLIL